MSDNPNQDIPGDEGNVKPEVRGPQVLLLGADYQAGFVALPDLAELLKEFLPAAAPTHDPLPGMAPNPMMHLLGAGPHEVSVDPQPHPKTGVLWRREVRSNSHKGDVVITLTSAAPAAERVGMLIHTIGANRTVLPQVEWWGNDVVPQPGERGVINVWRFFFDSKFHWHASWQPLKPRKQV